MTSGNVAQSVAAKSENTDRQNDATAPVETMQPRNGTQADPKALQAPSATTMPQQARSDDTVGAADDKLHRSDAPFPNAAVLQRKSIEGMENLYVELGYSYSEIGELFGGYSKSAISRHLSYLSDDAEKQRLHRDNRIKFNRDAVNVDGSHQPQQSSPIEQAPSNQQPTVEPASGIPLVIFEGANGEPQPSYLPRVNSEVYGPRPRIEDYHNGNDNSETPVHTAETGTPRPIRVIIDGRHPAIQSVFFELLQLATSRGLSLEAYLASETCSQDFRDLALAKQAIVGQGEIFRSNLLAVLKKSVAYDRNRRETGLITGNSDMMEDEL